MKTRPTVQAVLEMLQNDYSYLEYVPQWEEVQDSEVIATGFMSEESVMETRTFRLVNRTEDDVSWVTYGISDGRLTCFAS